MKEFVPRARSGARPGWVCRERTGERRGEERGEERREERRAEGGDTSSW